MEYRSDNSEHESDETKGILFGKYERGRLLGQGSFAKVYYGKNIKTSESVAIKIINKDEVKNQSMIDQIEREISVMRMVKHPNIVELKEVMATKQKIFFIMECVKGGELFAKVVKGKLKEEEARNYFQHLIRGIDFCHSRGVYHRDLKPENLLLDKNENLKVSDFGLSALPENRRCDGLLHTQCGTPAYAAPEVFKKKGYDGAKADIWSCGVILYALLAGFLPFQEENMMKMYRKVYKGEFVFPPWISPEAKRLISLILVPDPAKRISISGIMKSSWFLKGFSFSRSNSFSNQEILEQGFDKEMAPPFYNAFEFISSMSSGFDLSSLFEKETKSGSLFTSRCSASSIMEKLESVARKLNLRIVCSRGYRVRMQGIPEGRKGKLSVVAEVFEVAPEVAVVELSKCDGDTLEYRNLCEDVRPALKDIVWSWKGVLAESNSNQREGYKSVRVTTTNPTIQPTI